MRWLTGSVNGAQLSQALPLLLALTVFGGLLLSRTRDLEILQLGDDTAAALGVRVARTRMLVIVSAVGMIATATAVTGPIAFVAFLSGPIAARHRPQQWIPASAIGAGRSHSCACRRLCRSASLAEPLSGRRGDRRAGCALPDFPDRPRQPDRRLVVTVHSLAASGLSAGYDDREILRDLDLTIPAGKITAIVGANACGKSTLLRTMSRLISPKQGQVLLDGKSIHHTPSRELARTLGLLPQSPVAPEGIAVADLVSRGRHPHQSLFSRWTRQDDEAVDSALAATKTFDLAERPVDELSGGQRQRVWIAMALAQDTDILLLDEPTTFLDINHQIEVLDLLTDLNQARGTTVVMVLHDLNLAARYADYLVAMADGRVHAFGTPEEVLTQEMVRQVFGLESRIMIDPISARPIMLPIGRHRMASNAPAMAQKETRL